MDFNNINVESWNRKESFSHYFNDVPCTYSMTVELDISAFYAKTKVLKINFFPAVLYVISKVVNRHTEFRMDFDKNKNVGYYSHSNPCYTVFHAETETITNLWTEYNDNIDIFMQNYSDDMSRFKHDCHNSKPLLHSNIFNVSCIPWTSFKGFNLNIQKGYDYLLPIFTIGKYFDIGDKKILPLAVQVHHAVCDGFHLSRFINELQEQLDTI